MLPRTLARSVLLLLALMIVASSSISSAAPATAADIVVNDFNDDEDSGDGLCTLREALHAANRKARSGLRTGECAAGALRTVIRFSITEPIVLSQPLPAIESDVTLLGDWQSDAAEGQPVTISGGGFHRIMTVRLGTVRIRSIHFIGGVARGGDGGEGRGGAGGGGGGAGLGGALYIAGGTVTIENARFTDNHAYGGNGGNAINIGSSGWGGGGGGGMTRSGEWSLPAKGGDGGGTTVFSDDSTAVTPGGVPGENGQNAQDGFGGGGAGPNGFGRGGFGGSGGGGGGASSGSSGNGYAGAGGFGGGGGGSSLATVDSEETGANGGGENGGGGGFASLPTQGGGGGGGAGLGGAIFIQTGSHTIINSTFGGNSTAGGKGGTGSSQAGGGGGAEGGAIFLVRSTRLYSMSEKPLFPTLNSPDDIDGPGQFKKQTVVSISAVQNPSIAGTPGTFRITRLGPIDSDLTVTLKTSGTARSPYDYTIENPGNLSEVTIKKGFRSAEVTIYPVLNNLESVGRILTLELIGQQAYSLDTFPQAILTITSLPPPAWLVLLYVSADDALPQPAYSDTLAVSLNEPARDLLKRLSSPSMEGNTNVRVVILFDGNDTEHDSRVLVLNPGMSGKFVDMTASVPGSGYWPGFAYDAEQDRAEVDSGRVETLQGFISWSRQTYPDYKHSMLSIIDHGGGWAPDLNLQVEQPKISRLHLAGDGRGLSIDAKSGHSLSTLNTGQIFEGLGSLGQFDLIFFDACLMAMVESAYEIQPYTRYFVAGQNLLWAELPYERYLGKITQNTTPEQFAANLVADYGKTLSEPYAIAAVEMAQLPVLRARIAEFAQALLNHLTLNPGAAGDIRDAYLEAQKFDYDVSMSIDDATDAYVDIRSIAVRIKTKDFPQPIDDAADAVIAALEQAVLAPGPQVKSDEVETDVGTPKWDLSRASGLSIYMPLGERDCRPTVLASRAGANDLCDLPAEPAEEGEARLYEDQFRYYENPEQLAFTRDAKPWSDLLKKLRELLGDQISEPTLNAGERTASPPYLLQTAPVTVTTGTATAGSTEAMLSGVATTGSWDELSFEVTAVPGNYSQPITKTRAIAGTTGVTETQLSALIPDLDPVTTYYYRLVGKRGTRYIPGQELSFTTDYFRVRMPLIRNETRADLEVVSIQVIPSRPRVGQEAEVQITIRNNGPGAVGPAFWVDLYVNPRMDLDLKPNVLWNNVAPFGAAWRVYRIPRGETVILSTKLTGDNLDLAARYSEFSRFSQAGKNQLVVQVDSYQPGGDGGSVDEAREDNNFRSLDIDVVSDQEPVDQR